MKRWFLLLSLGFVVLIGFAWTSELDANVPNQQVVAAHFPRPVAFANAILVGDYVIVHDDDNADQGEPCLFVYRRVGEKPLVAVHCKRVARRQAKTFTVFTQHLTPELQRVTVVQFAGSAIGHQLH